MQLLGRCLLIGMLVFAPLYFGGNRPFALLALEVLGLLLMAVLGMQMLYVNNSSQLNAGLKQASQSKLNKAILFLLLLLFIWPLLTLIPIPFSVWQSIPSRQAYASALALIESNQQALPLSLVPALTEFSWLALIPPLAVFVYLTAQSTDDIKLFLKVFLVLALFQALLGLVQYGDGAQSVFRIPNPLSSQSAEGAYANRDHLAGLLEMSLPVALALFAAHLGRNKYQREHHRSLRQKLSQFMFKYMNTTALYGLMSLALLLGLVFTQSRMGVVLSMVVIMISGLAFAKRLGDNNAFGLVGTFAVLGGTLAAVIGLVPVLNRFTADPMQDSRWVFYEHTWQAVLHFFPFGSGAGTYQHALQAFQPSIPSNIIINHAHNDYLEWLMEGGLVAAIIMAGLLCCYLVRCLQFMALPRWSRFQFAQIGAGIGLCAMLIHTFFDFNLHIPANQIAFALLAAVFFHQETSKQTLH